MRQNIIIRGSEGQSPAEADEILLFQKLISEPNYEFCSPSEADDIFLFQQLISLKNYHINWGHLDYKCFLFGGI